MMTGEYIDNNTKDDDHFSTNLNEGLDTPLLLNDSLDPLIYNQPCLYGQKGFRRSSMDAQNVRAKRQLIAATSLCFIFMIAELIGGYAAGSLAIVTDAAHLLSDCISFIVALLAMWLSKKPPDNNMTFGYRRAEVFGAVISVFGIWILTTILVYLAFLRLIKGEFEIEADTMIVVSVIGVIINIIMGIILHGSCSLLPHGHSHNTPSTSRSSANYEHSHSNNHCHSHTNGSTTPTMNSMYLTPDMVNGRNFNLNRNNSFNSTLNQNGSLTHSRHNSVSKTLNNKPTDDLHMNNIDLLRTRNDEPLIHRMSLDGSLTRITVDNRSYSHSRLCDDIKNLQLIPQSQIQHRNSVDSSNSSSGDSGRPCSEEKQNINLRAAVIHVIGDFVQSVGVLVAAIIIKMNPNAKFADPICTFLFSIIVIFTTLRIMKDSLIVLLDAVPSSVVLKKLDTELSCIQGVRSVHHLNVWSLTLDWNIMSVHLIIDPNGDTDEILQAATTIARKGFDIKHSTIQIEKSPQIMLTENDNNGLPSLVQSSEDGDMIL